MALFLTFFHSWKRYKLVVGKGSVLLCVPINDDPPVRAYLDVCGPL